MIKIRLNKSRKTTTTREALGTRGSESVSVVNRFLFRDLKLNFSSFSEFLNLDAFSIFSLNLTDDMIGWI